MFAIGGQGRGAALAGSWLLVIVTDVVLADAGSGPVVVAAAHTGNLGHLARW